MRKFMVVAAIVAGLSFGAKALTEAQLTDLLSTTYKSGPGRPAKRQGEAFAKDYGFDAGLGARLVVAFTLKSSDLSSLMRQVLEIINAKEAGERAEAEAERARRAAEEAEADAARTRRNAEEARRRDEEARRAAEEARRREEAARKAADEARRRDQEAHRAEEERRRADAERARRSAEEQARKAQQEARKTEEARAKAEAAAGVFNPDNFLGKQVEGVNVLYIARVIEVTPGSGAVLQVTNTQPGAVPFPNQYVVIHPDKIGHLALGDFVGFEKWRKQALSFGNLLNKWNNNLILSFAKLNK